LFVFVTPLCIFDFMSCTAPAPAEEGDKENADPNAAGGQQGAKRVPAKHSKHAAKGAPR
jgi:hypothetical protein